MDEAADTSVSSSLSSTIFTNYPLISAFAAFALAQSIKFFTTWYLSLIVLMGFGCFKKLTQRIGSCLALVWVSMRDVTRFGIWCLRFSIFPWIKSNASAMYHKDNSDFALRLLYLKEKCSFTQILKWIWQSLKTHIGFNFICLFFSNSAVYKLSPLPPPKQLDATNFLRLLWMLLICFLYLVSLNGISYAAWQVSKRHALQTIAAMEPARDIILSRSVWIDWISD